MQQPNVPVGVSTITGLIAALIQACLAVYASYKEKDFATAIAGAGSVITLLTVLIGRFRQAIAWIKNPTSPPEPIAVDPPKGMATDFDLEGPGDALPDELAAIPETDPSTLPPDAGNKIQEG